MLSEYSVNSCENSMSKEEAFWDIIACSLAQVDRRFRGAYCLCRQEDVFMCYDRCHDMVMKELGFVG
jgi:hypothetical protein